MPEVLVNPYCAVADVQAEIKNSDSTLTDQITLAINRASRWIDDYKARDYCLHDFSSTALTITLWDAVRVDNILYLPFSNIITLTEVTEAGVILTEDADFVRQYDKKRREAIALIRLGGSLLSLITGENEMVQPRWMIGEPPSGVVTLKGKFGYDQASPAAIPTGLPEEIRWCAIQIAAAFTGHNRKEVVGVDGSKESIIDRSIPKPVYDMLGRKGPILI